MKILMACVLFFVVVMTSCYDDNGNYDYKNISIITIDSIKPVEVLGGSEHIVIRPVVTSSLEGNIETGNPNFEFAYKIELKKGETILPNQTWVDLNPAGTKDLDTLATFAAGSYFIWFTVRDRRTDVITSQKIDLKIASAVYEGYMVLCNEGPEKRVRLDMISQISKDRIVPAFDLLSSLGLPDLKNAIRIGWNPQQYTAGDFIYVMSSEGAYHLDAESFKTGVGENMKNIDFVVSSTSGNAVYHQPIGSDGWGPLAQMIVTDNGNAFVMWGMGAYEAPINTPVRGEQPAYKVAPYIGVSAARPGNTESALLYDTDNKRFIGWVYNSNPAMGQTCTPVPNPEEGKLFDFNTGMDLLYMEGTKYSDGCVYSVLQDADGSRHIYGINMADKGMNQESVIHHVNAPDFDKATLFAFHSQYPFMYYAVGNKVYSYHRGTQTASSVPVITLGEHETVTMLKFNLFVNPDLELLNDPSDEFMAKQFELMVGSYDDAAKNVNGGKLGFYKVENSNNTLRKIVDYSGFANIVDVVYRERR